MQSQLTLARLRSRMVQQDFKEAYQRSAKACPTK
jgi:hypothetical protein